MHLKTTYVTLNCQRRGCLDYMNLFFKWDHIAFMEDDMAQNLSY